MSFDIFTQSNSNEDPLRAFVDPVKVKEITEKLCSKRKETEDALKNCSDSEKDSLALKLLEQQNDMRTFGVTEIDYQVYLAKNQPSTN
ncbi:MAG: hypothetical protein KBC41_04185 [Candidatus Pacebacteria bacterium]|nr:hypothetical protein [Candidatus Paceibacterota bacterium]MBP9867242.1 hypothetical protein [Candidatus Paceibacterota bacterium]